MVPAGVGRYTNPSRALSKGNVVAYLVGDLVLGKYIADSFIRLGADLFKLKGGCEDPRSEFKNCSFIAPRLSPLSTVSLSLLLSFSRERDLSTASKCNSLFKQSLINQHATLPLRVSSKRLLTCTERYLAFAVARCVKDRQRRTKAAASASCAFFHYDFEC